MRFLFVWIFVVIGYINAKCCFKTAVNYVPKKGTCGDYAEGHVVESTWRARDPYAINLFIDTMRNYCVAEVCDDGKYHSYCTTKGTCNIFGCNCDGDCIKGDGKGDGVKQFEKNYKNYVENVAKSYNTYGSVIGLAEYIYDAATKNEPCCIEVYDHGKHEGKNLEICAKCEECINLPKEWHNRVSSYGAHNLATFYAGENCSAHSEKACRDFTYTGFFAKVDNLWGLLCSIEDLNKKTKSLRMH